MRLITVFLLITLTSGCSSILAKNSPGFGHPYYGVQASASNAVCVNFFAFVWFPPSFILTVPISIIDVSTSIIVDTVLLPVDIVMSFDSGKRPESSKAYICNQLG